MSLFASDQYRWRETYFVLFEQENRPPLEELKAALTGLGGGYEIAEESAGEDGVVEALTIRSAYDFAAMDISYVAGEEVLEQIAELKLELQDASLSEEEQKKLKQVDQCDARYDIYHFEQVLDEASTDGQDEYMDPGSLLAVIERLAILCQGVGVDPQSGTLM